MGPLTEQDELPCLAPASVHIEVDAGRCRKALLGHLAKRTAQALFVAAQRLSLQLPRLPAAASAAALAKADVGALRKQLEEYVLVSIWSTQSIYCWSSASVQIS